MVADNPDGHIGKGDSEGQFRSIHFILKVCPLRCVIPPEKKRLNAKSWGLQVTGIISAYHDCPRRYTWRVDSCLKTFVFAAFYEDRRNTILLSPPEGWRSQIRLHDLPPRFCIDPKKHPCCFDDDSQSIPRIFYNANSRYIQYSRLRIKTQYLFYYFRPCPNSHPLQLRVPLPQPRFACQLSHTNLNLKSNHLRASFPPCRCFTAVNDALHRLPPFSLGRTKNLLRIGLLLD